jgi:NAD(P)-dependent dehydrogenase (short-subunit alcohol dehydrogenase family)
MGRKDRGVAVVTGASSGIGRATAFYLAGKGFEVFAGVRKKSDADSLSAEAKEKEVDLKPLTIDVTKPRSIANAKATVQRRAGKRGVKGLVNNAGVGVGGPVEFLPLDDLRQQLEVNVIGHVAVTQAFLPLLRKGQGRIVNITSIGGRLAHPFMAPYHVSKYGMEALTESMRVELQPWGIWVAAVEPGNIDTQIWEKADKEVKQKRAGLPKHGEKLYRQSLDAMDKVIAESDGVGNPPEKVAKKVFHALTAMRPKPRYLVGGDARSMLSARAVLPVRTYDRVRSRAAGLPKRNSALRG